MRDPLARHIAFVRRLGAAAALCGAAGQAHAAALTVSAIDAAGKPLADAVVAVMVKGLRAQAAPGTSAQIAQQERQFLPMLQVVQTGTGVLFPNFDTVRHHVYSFSPVKKFELKLYVGTPAAPVVFDQPGVAVLGCNIHDRMQAHVVVVDTPHFGKTNASGQLVLDVPPGEHTLRAWHPALAESAWLVQPVNVPAAGARTGLALPVPAR
jgi:plastocyanin